MSTVLGRQLLVEFYECDPLLLDDEDFLRSHCLAAAKVMGATVVGQHSHRFNPIGVSVVVILGESHLSLHTWPEHGMASVDIFTCGIDMEPRPAKALLAEAVQAGRAVELEVERGQLGRVEEISWREAELAEAKPR